MFDKIGIYLATFALILACSLPAFGFHGHRISNAQIRQAQRQAARVNAQQQALYHAQLRALRAQQLRGVYYAPALQLQLNTDCCQGGGLQLNAGVGCSSLYR